MLVEKYQSPLNDKILWKQFIDLVQIDNAEDTTTNLFINNT